MTPRYLSEAVPVPGQKFLFPEQPDVSENVNSWLGIWEISSNATAPGKNLGILFSFSDIDIRADVDNYTARCPRS